MILYKSFIIYYIIYNNMSLTPKKPVHYRVAELRDNHRKTINSKEYTESLDELNNQIDDAERDVGAAEFYLKQALGGNSINVGDRKKRENQDLLKFGMELNVGDADMPTERKSRDMLRAAHKNLEILQIERLELNSKYNKKARTSDLKAVKASLYPSMKGGYRTRRRRRTGKKRGKRRGKRTIRRRRTGKKRGKRRGKRTRRRRRTGKKRGKRCGHGCIQAIGWSPA
jgi:hypothetical protein